MNPKLLIVDDDEETRAQMKWALDSDYDIIFAGDQVSAVNAFQTARPLVVLLDLGLPPHPSDPEEGMATLAKLTALDCLTKVIVITGQGEKEIGLRAIGGKAYDFMAKPVDMEELKILLKRAFHVAQLEREVREMQQAAPPDTFAGMLGTSAAMLGVFETIRKVATSDAPVLLLGESGTGKEMAARAIHQCGARKEGPFVAVNCSAIPETLLESELFGHEKGAFTGAHTQREGLFETSIGGTLFLDEVGQISLPLQV
ncbi:MAG: sigma 54-interacting transcriptional regulator, partial [Verrucomicrobiota bacterium]